MTHISLAKEAHKLIKNKLYPGAIAIDATVGNGYDTLFLAEQVGVSGKIYGFDIQQTALDISHSRLQQAKLLQCLTLIHANHGLMAEKIPVNDHGKISAIMFNLGYLPGGDKTIMTSAHSTLQALNSAIGILSNDGIITILCYPGHSGGNIETEQVKKWCGQLDSKRYRVELLTTVESNISAPILFSISKSTPGPSIMIGL